MLFNERRSLVNKQVTSEKERKRRRGRQGRRGRKTSSSEEVHFIYFDGPVFAYFKRGGPLILLVIFRTNHAATVR